MSKRYYYLFKTYNIEYPKLNKKLNGLLVYKYIKYKLTDYEE